jgi:hypothetical protein
MTPDVVDAVALYDTLTTTLSAPAASWPSAIKSRLALFDLATISSPQSPNSESFTREFFAIICQRGVDVEQHLLAQGQRGSALESSTLLASAITALPRLIANPNLAPPNVAFRRRLRAFTTTSLQLETIAILATEQELAGQFMGTGQQGRALADMAKYLAYDDAFSLRDLSWVASFYAQRDRLVELATELVALESPTVRVAIAPIAEPYSLHALRSLVLRSLPISWATTFVHVTGGSGWRDGDAWLVTPSVALALDVWRDCSCVSAIGLME